MNCEEFLLLEEYQKAEYCAQLIHACTSDSSLFQSGQHLIDLGKRKGLFDKVKFGSETINQNNDGTQTV